MAFGDVVLRAGPVPRHVLAGADNAYRPGRDLVGSDPGGGVVPSGRDCGAWAAAAGQQGAGARGSARPTGVATLRGTTRSLGSA